MSDTMKLFITFAIYIFLQDPVQPSVLLTISGRDSEKSDILDKLSGGGLYQHNLVLNDCEIILDLIFDSKRSR